MGIEIVSYKQVEKGSLKGIVTIRMSNVGMEIKDLCVFEKAGKRWVNLPSKQVKDKTGEMIYAPVIEFFDNRKRELFRDAVLDALDAWRKAKVLNDPMMGLFREVTR